MKMTHPPPFKTEVKNEWIKTSTPTAVMSWTGTDLPSFNVPFLRRIPGTLSPVLSVAVAGKFPQDHDLTRKLPSAVSAPHETRHANSQQSSQQSPPTKQTPYQCVSTQSLFTFFLLKEFPSPFLFFPASHPAAVCLTRRVYPQIFPQLSTFLVYFTIIAS
jgi:hypothetical protein